VSTGIDYAPAAFEHLVPHVDRFVSAWEHATTQTCLRSEVEDAMRPEVAVRAQQCLEEARWALDELVDVLAEGGPEGVQRAVPMGASLPRVDVCGDEDRLAVRTASPIDPATREAAASLRRELQRARSLRAVGRFDEAYALAGDLSRRCEEIDWPPLCAEVQVDRGGLAVEVGKLDQAEAFLEQGFLWAAEAGAIPTMSAAAGTLTVVVGGALQRPDEGIRWGRMALALSAGVGLDTGLQGAQIQGALGGVYQTKGALSEALELHRGALASEEQILGARHPRVAESTLNIGIIHYDLGDYDEALHWQTRALATFEETLGAEHPDVARCLNNLAVLHYAREEPAQTRELLERALVVRERSLGRDHPDVAGTLTNLANLRQIDHDYDGALHLLARAKTIYESTFGPDHPLPATVEANIAQAHASQGDFAGAEPLLHHALAVYERAYGPTHAEVARTHLKLGELHESAGDEAAAAVAFDKAAAIFKTTLGEEHPETLAATESLARVE
jgi:tetratricopeptide (TPR) repeat protein